MHIQYTHYFEKLLLMASNFDQVEIENLYHHWASLLLLSPKADTHFTVPQRVEG